VNTKQTDVHPFTLDKTPDGRLRRINRRKDDKEITVPIDASNRDFCDFLAWASANNPEVADGFECPHGNVIYCANEKEVIDYCKSNAIVLQHVSLMQKKLLDESRGTRSSSRIALCYINPEDPTGNYLAWLFYYPLSKAVPWQDSPVDDPGYGLNSEKLPLYVDEKLLEKLFQSLQRDDSEIRCLSSFPVDRTFVYVDISGFSQHPVGHQVLLINWLNKLTSNVNLWGVGPAQLALADREASLCIGDGYIFVFRKPSLATFFSGYLAGMIEHLVARKLVTPEFHFRISAHTGPVFRFWDGWGDTKAAGAGRWNYVGRGITDGERVLSAIGKDRDDVVFISAETRKQIMAHESSSLFPLIPYLKNRGRHADKHGQLRRVYELDHASLVEHQVGFFVAGLRATQETLPNSGE
jgi:hypothetical protein